MKLRLGVVVALAAGAVGVLGCGGPDCEAICEEAAECNNGSLGSSENCAAECQQLEDQAEERDCSGELDDYLDCIEGADDICNPEECTPEAFEFLGCYGFDGGEPSCATYSSGSEPDCSVGQLCDDEPDRQLSCLDEECTCSEDGEAIASVAYEAAFCEGEDLEAKVEAASQACGW